ncbi:KGK domain-containing protein [Oscillatoria sp. FACHB-1406]|uniref:KGK domain-containing protein n=1 Tax=Oscillatoria sp. FACHB-1406 TaxID=2692846 RepID=UPI00168605B5|nr:KGK domain-containing protein [Oscillatoria sp. FACHB-1406]MBD2577443.1 KGK family protein [Oscillatoria sp. FACHB-1406]
MEALYRAIDCNENDVISFGEETFKIGRFKKALYQCFDYDFGYGLIGLLGNQGIKISKQTVSAYDNHEDYTKWFNEGIDCEILKTDVTGWQKAKVKIKVSVEFSIEEDESQLAHSNGKFLAQDTDATLDYDINLISTEL